MPRNRRGRRGQGPRAGRGFGFCGGANASDGSVEVAELEARGALGVQNMCGGRRSQWRHGSHPIGTPTVAQGGPPLERAEPGEAEKVALQGQAAALRLQLEPIEARLKAAPLSEPGSNT
jgi:hypothetical protein